MQFDSDYIEKQNKLIDEIRTQMSILKASNAALRSEKRKLDEQIKSNKDKYYSLKEKLKLIINTNIHENL